MLKFIAAVLLLLSATAGAQVNSGTPFQFEASVGNYLPSRIPGMTEVMRCWDLRVSLPTGKGHFEIDVFDARGDGVTYRSGALDYRYDLPNDVFPAIFLIGFNGDIWNGTDSQNRFSAGWHFGGGLFQTITSNIALREDFRYRFGPGQSLVALVGVSLNIN